MSCRWIMILALLFLWAVPVAAAPSPAVPLDSWVYPALDKLTGLGLISSSLQGDRPFSRAEAARQTIEAVESGQDHIVPSIGQELVARLKKEFRQEIRELHDGAEHAESYFKPIREMRFDYVFRDGADSYYPGTNARQFALLTNRDGLDYGENHNLEVSLSGDARWGKWLLVDWRPLLRAQEDGNTGLRLRQGNVTLGLGPVELSVGRQSLWWGQGRNGSLVLTNNADPLDMIRLTNPTPVVLPWIFKYLGAFRFDLFTARLDDDRDVAEPYFGGMRIGLKPTSWLELGLCRTVMFGGEGRPGVGFDDFLTIIGGENLSGAEDTSNSVAAIDVRIKLPFLWNAELYGELGGEDQADFAGFLPFFSKKAYLAGLYLPQIEPSGRLSLRLEYADTGMDTNIWYRHSQYTSGYTYQQKIMGHAMGGTAQDYFAELEAYFPLGLRMAFSLDHQQRSIGGSVSEKHYQPGVAVTWHCSPQLTLRFDYAFDRVENFAYQSGETRNLHMANAGVNWNW
ncbi:MAG: capsule assembly Wzi family protein [Pedobacter sp.]